MRFRNSILIISLLIHNFAYGCRSDHSGEDARRDFYQLYYFLIILPRSDFNRYCPPDDQIPVYNAGTYTKYLTTGEEFLFDITARRQATGYYNKQYTFTVQEAIGQNIKFVVPNCMTGSQDSSYSGQFMNPATGQFETIKQALNPADSEDRSYSYSKFVCTVGAGTFTFSIPAKNN